MKEWIFSPSSSELAASLSKNIGLSPIVASLLVKRGVTTPDDIESFINPKLKNFKDPFDIPNIKKGAERIVQAKQNNEKVVVYGDYDVDGVSGTSLLVETLNHLKINSAFYIPHRYGEGYSLNIEAIRKRI